MAELKVDVVRHDYNEANGKLIVWLFNDPSFYSKKAWKLTAKYDFGRKPNDEEGNPTDKKQKLLVGLYREPFRDGCKDGFQFVLQKMYSHYRSGVESVLSKGDSVPCCF